MRANIARILWTAGTPLRALLLGALLLYRAAFGGMFAGRCRFHPSCSAYAVEAVRIHGAIKGLGLGVWRVLRCSPLSGGGLDPVPSRGTGEGQAVVR
jgi:uncharacterized protein